MVAWGVFVCLWAGISYFDWKHRRIPNWVILASAFPALAMGAFGSPPGGSVQLILPALCLLLAVVLWQMDIWPAGDAKLFVLLALYLPLLLPVDIPVAKLSIVWLANIFVPAAVALIAQSFWQAAFRERRRLDPAALLGYLRRVLIPNAEGKKEGLFGIAFILFSCGLANLLYRQTTSQLGPSALWLASFGLFVLGGPVRRLIWSRTRPWIAAGCAIGLAAFLGGELSSVYSWSSLKAIMIMALLFHIFMSLTFDALERLETINISPASLRQRMVLAESCVKTLRPEPAFGALGRLYKDGLTIEQVRGLQALCRRRNIPEVSIYRCYAFAFWIFSGTTLTALLRQDVITSLRRAL